MPKLVCRVETNENEIFTSDSFSGILNRDIYIENIGLCVVGYAEIIEEGKAAILTFMKKEDVDGEENRLAIQSNSTNQ